MLATEDPEPQTHFLPTEIKHSGLDVTSMKWGDPVWRWEQILPLEGSGGCIWQPDGNVKQKVITTIHNNGFISNFTYFSISNL